MVSTLSMPRIGKNIQLEELTKFPAPADYECRLFLFRSRGHQCEYLPKREMNSDCVRPPASANFAIDASSRKSLAPTLTI